MFCENYPDIVRKTIVLRGFHVEYSKIDGEQPQWRNLWKEFKDSVGFCMQMASLICFSERKR